MAAVAWTAALCSKCLEAERRSQGYPQVVACAISEVDFVAHFQSCSDWSPEALNASAGVERKLRGPVSNVSYRGCETGGGVLVRSSEVYESKLAGDEGAKWA